MGTLGLSTDRAEPVPCGVGFGVPGGTVAIGDVIADKYKIERVLGRGGMGYVLCARHEPLGHQVAIKVLVPELCKSQEAVARFLREARAAVSILSEHVARVLDVGTLPDGAPFMVMEFLEGRDLARELEEGVLPVRETVEYVLQACEALAEAHALGIVHRDLKPANLFHARRADGSAVIKVLDFGVSNIVPSESEAPLVTRLTDTKSLVGSPCYMSPEQVRDPKTVDPRSDIWSLGVIVHELLTGSTPFGSDCTLSVLAGVVADEPPKVRSLREDVPIGLQDVILKCLEKRASSRYATVVEFAEALAVYTPTGEAAVARISAVARSAGERGPAGRRRAQGSSGLPRPEARRISPVEMPTLESPRAETRRRPKVPWWAGVAAVGALCFGATALRWRSAERFVHHDGDGPSSRAPAIEQVSVPPSFAPSTVTAVTVATAAIVLNDTPRAGAVASTPPSRLSLNGAKKEPAAPRVDHDGSVARPSSPAFGAPGLEPAFDPLEGRE